MAKVEIYTKDYCSYCTKAKMLLDQMGVEYEEIDLSEDPDRLEELQERAPAMRSLPQIFINDQSIGGCDDLYKLHAEGELTELLKGV